MINIKELQKGDVFSEISHYTYQGKTRGGHEFLHHASQRKVALGEEYIVNLLTSGNLFDDNQVIEVGKLDKYWTAKQLKEANNTEDSVGDVRVPGIRSLFESIHSQTVFTVCFKKQDKPLSKTALNKAKKLQLESALEEIEKASRQKKGVAKKAAQVLSEIQDNPVQPFIEGESRVLTGYKVQFESIDGKYQCMDMGIEELRPVNINTIEWLIYKGVKYVVK